MPLVCPTCKGKKQVAPLGGILKDCAYCKGIGWVSIDSFDSNKDAKKLVSELNEIVDLKAKKLDKRSKEYRALKLANKA